MSVWPPCGARSTINSTSMKKSTCLVLAALLGVWMPVVTSAQQPIESPLADPELGIACPLGRVAMVRGSDSEAREGGGFEAARGHGIHGAIDLNGTLGEPVFAIAAGKVVVAARSDWGKLGRAVVIDHPDAGQMIGTMGYSGNARALQAKRLPPHLHFAYVRGTVSLAKIRDSGDGFEASLARNNALWGVSGVLHPMWAVRFLKCWENPLPVGPSSVPSRLIMR